MTRKSIHADSYRKLVDPLKRQRESQNITQSALAALIGEDQSMISKVETYERRLDIEELRVICEALGSSLIEILSKWEDEINPQVSEVAATYQFPAKPDRSWSEEDWSRMMHWLIRSKLVTYQEIASLTLGHLNPSQVGTSIASKKSFQKHFPPRKCWQAVCEWHFKQSGHCADCGTRLELQADHIIPREELGEAADTLENMTLRCRRCNVIKRPSHANGGQTFLTAEAALMWLLFTQKPKSYAEFEKLCRTYGMTMANIRFQEAWAMAKWLAKEGLYAISEEHSETQHRAKPRRT